MIEKILSTRLGRFIQLVFTIYTLIWALAEPLNLTWITQHPSIWRVILVSAAFVIALVLFIDIVGSTLETIDTSSSNIKLQDFKSLGNPSISVSSDGQAGSVMVIKGDYNKDELDWQIKTSAQRAGVLVFRFSHKNIFHFYVRVMVKSKEGQAFELKWIRFENGIGKAEDYAANKNEMGCPYDAENDGNLQKVTINIKDAVKKTYGQGGWEYDRVVLFRVRGEGIIKSIVFKK